MQKLLEAVRHYKRTFCYFLNFRNVREAINQMQNRKKLKSVADSIGKNCQIIGKLGLNVKGQLTIGDNFTFTSGGFLNPLARNICGYIRINKGAEVTIGNNVGISSAVLWCASKISIGNDVKIGALAMIIDTDAHSLNPEFRRNTTTDKANTVSRPITIGNNVLIGAQAIICKGVTIGDNSIVGIGSVVTKSIPANQIWAGNPARFIREL